METRLLQATIFAATISFLFPAARTRTQSPAAQDARRAAASRAAPLQAPTPAAQQIAPGDEHFFEVYRHEQPIKLQVQVPATK